MQRPGTGAAGSGALKRHQPAPTGWGRGLEQTYPDYAAQAWPLLCWLRWRITAGLLCERMLASASGSAVVQKAHSADIRPISQWVRPHPGQLLT